MQNELSLVERQKARDLEASIPAAQRRLRQEEDEEEENNDDDWDDDEPNSQSKQPAAPAQQQPPQQQVSQSPQPQQISKNNNPSSANNNDADEMSAVAIYDYQAGQYYNYKYLRRLAHSHLYCSFAADEDEISFDPGDIITNIEMVKSRHYFQHCFTKPHYS